MPKPVTEVYKTAFLTLTVAVGLAYDSDAVPSPEQIRQDAICNFLAHPAIEGDWKDEKKIQHLEAQVDKIVVYDDSSFVPRKARRERVTG